MRDSIPREIIRSINDSDELLEYIEKQEEEFEYDGEIIKKKMIIGMDTFLGLLDRIVALENKTR